MISLLEHFIQTKMGKALIFTSLLLSFMICGLSAAIELAAVLNGDIETVSIIHAYALFIGSAASQYIMVTKFGKRQTKNG